MKDDFHCDPIGILEAIKKDLQHDIRIEVYNEVLNKAVELHKEKGDRLYYLYFTDYLIKYLAKLNEKK